MKPKLRPLDLQPLGDRFWIRDPFELSEGLVVSYPALLLLSLMDGSRDLLEVKGEFFKRTGYLLGDVELLEFIKKLDSALLLDNENFHLALREEREKLLQKGLRPMSHVGEVYPAEEEECRSFLRGEVQEKREMLGLMVPHMDLRVARETYWKGYGRLRDGKKLVIVLGVSHYWHEMPFSLLPLDMETPFGVLKVRKDLVEKLQSLYSFDLTHDLLSYRREHSIEFASLYAKMLFPEAQALALIISYWDKNLLMGLAENLLRLVEGELEDTLVISSVDLSHVGRKFGDKGSYDPSPTDRTYLELLQNLQVEEAFDFLEREKNPTRIDGIYTNLVFSHMLRTAGIEKGEMFDYSSFYEEATDSLVSYASLGF
ncbi:MAG: AmmeMemoRadiSam system protein B [Aquificaceae bacterium]|nr:AmmeMemoRadiSam system protein B [Aquificaceae bacterium]